MRRILPMTLIILVLLALVIPAHAQDGSRPATHTVQPGENLFRIALRYGVTVEALMQSNGPPSPQTPAAAQQTWD